MTERTGGDVVVDVLARSGVEVIFGIPSVHNLPIYDAIRRDGRIRVVSVRHEQGAVGAADGFAVDDRPARSLLDLDRSGGSECNGGPTRGIGVVVVRPAPDRPGRQSIPRQAPWLHPRSPRPARHDGAAGEGQSPTTVGGRDRCHSRPSGVAGDDVPARAGDSRDSHRFPVRVPGAGGGTVPARGPVGVFARARG